MLYLGKNIRTKNDKLEMTSWAYLLKIIQEDTAVASQVDRLRKVYQLDKNRYNQQKVHLPYFIPSRFREGKRHGENFEKIYAFILDIDKLSDYQLFPSALKEKISQDPRVLMAFTSPSGDGLKLVFRLNTSEDNPRRFQAFYRIFAREFMGQYYPDLEADIKTCDVTRVCFLSHDPEAYWNETAQAVSIDDYAHRVESATELPFESEPETNQKQVMLKKVEESPETRSISSDTYAEIRTKLHGKARVRKPKAEAYAPEILEELDAGLIQCLETYGMQLGDATKIQYGRKFRIAMGEDWAEFNVFYGKKGFSVVKVPKKQTHKELSDLGLHIIETYVWQDFNPQKSEMYCSYRGVS